MLKYLIAILVLWMIYRFSKKNQDEIIINKDTKIQYPSVINNYSKENIYKSFIKYCKFNINKDTKIDFKKVKDAEFEDNE